MRHNNTLNHSDDKGPTGYSGATMGSGRNSGEQEKESWKDAEKPSDITANDESKTETKEDADMPTRQGTPTVSRGDKDAHGQSGVVKIRK